MSRQAQLHWSQVKVGVLIIVALGVLVAMILNLEGGMGFVTSQTRFRAVVAHTQGLKVGGPVRMNGVDIGNIRQIGIAEDRPMVEIDFSVKTSVASHIRQDAMVTIRPMGLLGDKFLEIHPGSPTKPALPPEGLLKGQAETDLAAVASEVGGTMEKFNDAIGQIQQILVELRHGQGTASKLITDPSLYDQSQRVLKNLEAASGKSLILLDKVDKGEGTIGRLLTDKDLYERATHAVQELNQLTAKLNSQDGTLAKLADPTLYKRLDQMTLRGERLLNELEHGHGTLSKLVTQDDLYRRADKVLTDVENLIADVKANPTKYFKITVF